MVNYEVGDKIMSTENWHLSGTITAVTAVFIQYKSFIGNRIRNIHVDSLTHYKKI